MKLYRILGLMLTLNVGCCSLAHSAFNEDFRALGIGIQTTYQDTARSYTQQRGSLLQTTPSYTTAAPRPCSLYETMERTATCISRSAAIHEALQEQARYLGQIRSNKLFGSSQAPISKGELEQAIRQLSAWNRGSPHQLADLFSLQELNFGSQGKGAKYTGYITPALNVKRTPDRRFRIPIYAKPRSGANYSHADISQGALAGKGLEVAWTDDPIELYFAQIQGAANAVFPDGSLATLVYAGNNGQPYKQVANYLKAQGYKLSGLGNDSIRQWLRNNPTKIGEVLTSNPRFVYFNLKEGRPKTATGAHVIPWHTVAVDDKHIPLGSVLLAELPDFDASGREIGTRWQLLFAQDRGSNIKGDARIDLYLGNSPNAEATAQKITGYRRTYLLRPKSG